MKNNLTGLKSLFSLILGLTLTSLYAQTPITTTIGSFNSSTCAVGDTIVLPVTVNMASGISTAAISMAIDYDTTKLRCISAVTGLNANIATGFLSNCGFFGNQSPNPPYTASSRRQFRAAWFNLTPVAFNGVMFNIRFVVVATGNSSVKWDVATAGNCEYADELADVIPNCSFVDGGVTCGSSAPVNCGITLTSAAGTTSQAICQGSAITNITYSTVSATGATVSGLPAGVTGSWASNAVTISGTATAAGTFNYTVTLSGCSGGTNTASGTITVSAPASAGTLSGTQAICVGGTSTFASSVSGGSWSSSAAGVATVNATTGVVNGVGAGTATITYTVQGTGGCANATATRTVTVTAPASAGTLSGTQNICVGGTTNFASTVTGGSWSSSATGVATVNATTGVVTGVAAGTATITYTVTGTGGCANATATRTVTVSSNNTITLSSASGTNAQAVTVNTPITNITYTTTGATGATFSGLPAGVSGTWASNTVTISGTPTATGTFSYTVTMTGGCTGGTNTATGSITVNAGGGGGNFNIQTTIGSFNSSTCAVGDTIVLPVTVNMASGISTAAISMAIDYDTTKLRCISAVTGLNANIATGFLSNCGFFGNQSPNPPYTASSRRQFRAAWFNLTPVAFNGVMFNIRFVVVATGNSSVKWDVATAGNCEYADELADVIPNCSFVDGGVTCGSAAPVNCGITLTSAAGTTSQAICQGSAITNITYSTVSATGATVSGLPAGVTGTWASNAVTISGTATAAGTFNYTVTLSGCSGGTNTASGTITVAAPVSAGTLSGTQAICIGGTSTFVSSVSGGSWSSSATGVATVNATTGVVTGVAAGQATITYTVTGTGGCANATATRTVTVTAPASAGTLSGTQAICVGGTSTFVSSVSGGSWSSSVTGVATVNATTGVVTGVAAGTATITYTVPGTGGCANATATRTVTVTAPASAGTLSGTQAICIGGTSTFVSSVSGGSWSSSATGVATVNATTGVVTGVAAGTATITYTVTGTGGCANATATRTVTVNSNSSAAISAAICQGQAYSFGSQSLTNAGTYTRTIPAANGCDSVITLTLSVKVPATSSVTVTAGATVCGQVFPNPGTFTKVCSGAAANGCDSIITLTVNPAGPNISTSIGSASGCVGDTVTVPITINMASGISTAAISMAIDYDTTKLRCISAVTGLNANIATGFLSNCGLFSSLSPNAPYNASTRRQFRAAWFNLVPVAFNGLMFNVRFVILAPGSSPILWDLSNPGNCEYADELADVIPNTEWINGSIATGSNCCTATASITPAGSTTFCQGGSVTLNANTGTGLSYQWSKNGSPISGASNASYTASASGSYTVTVSSSPNCSATSSPVAVTVKPNSSAAISAAICQGQAYSFGSQSLTNAGTYTRTIPAANGCDSVITLTLSIKPNSSAAISAAICQGQAYSFGSQSLTNAGTYTRTIPAANGCDSVITLTLSVKVPATSSVTVTAGATVCGQVFPNPGTFTKVCSGAAANGCDSIITLTVNPAGPNISTSIGSASGCVGDTVTVPITINMASGISTAAISMAIDYDTTKLRCISAVTGLNANIATGFLSNCGLFSSLSPNAPYNASTRRQFRAAWFNLVPVAFNGLMFNVRFVILAPGSSPILWDLSNPGNCEYADELADVIPNTEWINGSIATGSNCCTATASITPAGSTTFCQGGSVTLNANTGTGLSYQWSKNGSPISGASNASYTASASGSYTVTVSSSPNCSATSSPVAVTVKPNSSAAISAAICQGQAYSFGSQSLTNAGTYTRTIPAANGCDSVITLTLSIKPNSSAAISAAICQGQAYSFGSQSLTNAGTYTRTIPAANGCDSVITLTLSVKVPATSSVTVTAGATVCGQVFPNPGTFTKVCSGAAANGCDSIITLTVNPAGPNISTSIGSASGCVGDTVTVPITINMASGISTAAISMAIDYDTTKLRCISAVTGLNANIATGFLSNCGLFSSLSPNAPYNASTRRQFRAAWFNLVPVAFNGLMFNVRFVILAPGSSPILWDLSNPGNCEYADELADVIPNTEWINGSIATGSNCCTATASITPAGSTTFCQGGSVTLNANTGTGLSYQWSKNGSPISGASNASYTASASGSYTVTVSSSPNCSATSSPVAVTVKPNSSAAISAAICQGQAYSFGSQSLTNAGTYTRTIPAANGCDSVITLTLSIKPNSSAAISAAICQGQAYSFGSQSLTNAGTYTRTIPAANGCDSVITLTLSVKVPATSSVTVTAGATVCGQVFPNPGTFTKVCSGAAANGCDSIITLTVNPAGPNISTSIGSASGCVGDTVTVPITINMASGISTAAISMAIDYDTTKLRCISAVTGLNANIATGFLSNCGLFSSLSPNAPYNASTRRQFRAAWFNLVPVAFNGLMFNVRFVILAPGSSPILWDLSNPGNCEYADELADVIPNTEWINGSIATGSNCCTATASITPAGSTTFCQGGSVTLNANTGTGLSYQWSKNGSPISGASNASYTASASGSYTVTVSSSPNCSATSSPVAVTVKPNSSAAISAAICQGQAYSFGSQSLTNAGTYTRTIPAANGCDSVITLTLSIKPNSSAAISAAICQGQAYSFGSQSLTNAGTYTRTIPAANGCDSVITLTLSVKVPATSSVTVTAGATVCGQVFPNPGTFTKVCSGAAANGCDSIITLTVNPAGPNISTSIGSASGCVGDTVTVPITINMASGISTAAISMAIDYDTTKLRCISAVTGLNANIATGFLSNCGLFSSLSPNAPYNASTRRQFRAAWFNLVPVAFNGLMFNVRFVILAPGSSPILWDLSNPGNCEYADEIADVIPNTEWINGSIATGSNCCTATASITPAGSTTFCQGGSVTLNANTGTGLSYQWSKNGSPISGASNASYTASASGSYTVTVSSSPNCSATSSPVAVTVKPNSSAAISAAICQGQAYSFGSQSLTNAGTYTRTIPAANGCDSVITLTLSIKPNSSAAISAAICQGQAYSFGSQSLTNAGTYTRTIPAANGCDSVITLTLSIKLNSSAAISAAICQGQAYSFGSQSLTNAGTYTQTIPAANGCDSVITLTLVVNPTFYTNIVDSICPNQNYIFGNQTITSTGTYSQTLFSVNGCDSVISLTLFPRIYCLVSTTISSVIGCVGDTVEVPVSVQNGFGIASISMAIGYDPTKLTCISSVSNVNSAIASSLLTNCGVFNGISQFRAAWFDLNPVNLNGNLFTMKFVVRAPGTHQLNWDLATPGNCEYTDANANVIPGTIWNNGSVTLGSNCCSAFAEITPAGPLAICQGNSVTLNANTGTGLSYQWALNGSPVAGATNSSLIANAAGAYTVSVSQSATCSFTSAAVNVLINSLPTATISAGGPTTFCQGASVTLNANTGAGLTYQWLLNNSAIAGATNASLVANAQGAYAVTVSDANGCSATSSALNVTVRSLPIATITGASAFCAGGNTILSANTGTGRTYQWRRNNINIIGATASNYTVVTAGTYTVAVTANTCLAVSNAITVSVNSLPTASIAATGNTSICQGSSITLDATTDATNSIQWRRNGTNITGATNSSYLASEAGSYTVRVTTPSGCLAISNAIVVSLLEIPSIITQPQNYNTNLYDSAIFSVQANGGNAYQWQVRRTANSTFTNVSNNQFYSGANTSVLIVRALTLNLNNYEYRCIISNSCGQVISSNAAITVNTPPTIVFYIDNQIACQNAGGAALSIPVRVNNFTSVASMNGKIKLPSGSTLTTISNVNTNLTGFASALIGSDTVSFSWFRNHGVTIQDSSILFRINLTYQNNSNGTLTWIPNTLFAWNEFNGTLPVSGGNGQISSTDIPIVNAGSDISTCPGASVILSGTGNAGGYTWSNGATGLTITVNPTITTNYILTGTNSAGCSNSDTVTVFVNPTIPVQIAGNDTITICSNGSGIQLNATGATSYNWFPSTGLSSNSIANPIANPATTTQYRVVGISSSGCVSEDLVTILVTNPTSISFTLSNPSICLSEPSVVLNATPIGGIFAGNGVVNGAFDPSVAGIGVHSITYTYTDPITGCSSSSTQNITVNSVPNGTAGPDESICLGQSVILTASGGTSYLWSNGSSGSSISVNPQQSSAYFVNIFNNNGCSIIDTVNVIVNQNAPITFNGNTSICSGGNTQITVSGANSYTWTPNIGINSTSISNPIFNPQSTTTYTVYGINSNGCISSNTLTIVVNEQPVVSAGNDKVSCGNPVTLTANGNGPLSYLWNTGDTTASITVNPQSNSTYSVTATNANGCSATDSVSIFIPIAYAGSNQTICKGGATQLNANLFNTPGTLGNLIYSWSPSTGLNNSNTANPIAKPSITTVYTVTIRDALTNCIFNSTMVVLVLPTPQVDLGSNISLAPGNSINLSAAIANSTSGITYTWNLIGGNVGNLLSGSGPNATFTAGNSATLVTQSVVLIANNPNGCSGQDTLEITIDPSLGGHNISGIVQYANTSLTPVNEGIIILRGPQGSSKTVTIAPGGNFFLGNVLDSAYTISTQIAKDWGGITVADAQLINDHAISISNLNSIYLKAADVTGDGNVLSNDAQQTARRAANLSIQNSFDQGTGPGNWVNDTIQLVMNNSHIIQNLSVLAKGDVNGSYSPILRQITNLNISGENLRFINSQNSQKQHIKLQVNQKIELGSFQMEFELPQGTRILGIKTPFSKGNLLSNFIRNKGLIVWYKDSEAALNLSVGDDLLIIDFEILDSKENLFKLDHFAKIEFNDPSAHAIPLVSLRTEILKETLDNTLIDIYPNPNQGSFVIHSNALNNITSIQITNLSGQILKEIFTTENTNNILHNPIQINLPEFPAGHYMINAFTTEGVFRKKIVISR